jgi:copper homeostasis protein
MAGILEVIVTSADEAKAASKGGADRLELVRSLECAGLTPDTGVVRDVVQAVSTPVRVMVRESNRMTIGDDSEIRILRARAREMAEFSVDGIVLGFVRDGEIDRCGLLRVLEAVPRLNATFHRAFDEVRDPLRTIDELKQIGQIDYILTNGGAGEWPERKRRLLAWQKAASPEITFIVAAGLCPSVLADLNGDKPAFQFHVGRAARVGRQVSNPVDSNQVAALKNRIR